MSTIEQSIDAVNRVHRKLGNKRFAELTGVPYVTVYEQFKRGFPGPAVKTFAKMALAAERFEAEAIEQNEAA